MDADNPALEPDLGELRALGRRLVDDYVDGLARLRDEPAWRRPPPDVRERLQAPLARAGIGLEATYRAFQRDVLPYRYGNVHPRFWGWVNGSGLPAGVLADFLASGMNSNTGAFDQASVLVEEQVLSWMRGVFGHPADGDGILTSGGSMANLLALTAALVAKAPFDVRRIGLAAGGARLTVYGSSETHSSITKAVELLGLGREQFRALPTDGERRLVIPELVRALAADRAHGFTPFALIGNAGTVNTGATDDLAALADLARREDLWLHVDGAFGALAWLAPEERGALAGLERAHSLAFDLHKWLYLPSDVGCVLVRERGGLERAFGFQAPYLVNLRGGLSAATDGSFKDRGLELTRRFRALKVWFALQAHGLGAFEAGVRANLAQARHLVALVRAEPRLELVAPAPLNVVCFRYREPGLDDALLNELNQELLVRLQEGGVAVPSQTVLDGRFALRAAITNHRTELADVELTVREVLRLGAELAREARRSPAPDWIRSLPSTTHA